MHNLYLGTAKRMIQIWRKCNYINEKNQLTMQELANGIVVPCGYARITKKIADGFSFMKADKWKLWCVIYSPFVLKHVLPAKNLENWILFVDACRLLTKPSIIDKEIDEAHSKLQLFCTRFQTLYGKSAMTPNMHLHLHLGECVHDFGPIYAFYQDQLAALHPSSTASIFSLSDFVEYSLNPRHSALGCEPLPPSVFPIKLDQRITMCKGHYECLLEFYRHAYGSHDLFGHYSNCKSNQIFVNNRIEKMK
ncbi:hypothetical protein PHYBLDRAFT_171470 [Phycomyces blakesleeanus NRRL 1555(-)]|uniref:Uncharacterized protein n=1 Tax=Phycomyces blakesleeanus (strain ATCC 8743b / DSM 1359 / FGSC 10004 / NBRC 33097 / NRRL 1555) TaxID=763407 RepID=A0A167LBN4_PHYB8|nr:hypothetical protein PHYBLDRAFT_171470 [Phycomyces blakesleeanus NRRL 1555(-)]OAD70077.1 hypothetical protein PHYBLDRAFT_171470 [Phycomyces blakesleeanus NRRL 1555(-)]|eukprot:XP_018288117.1 hypothetical protein PHYBLDRAFT_171470 [Phycomyces blakesleeanus NRRL 1555(-)]